MILVDRIHHGQFSETTNSKPGANCKLRTLTLPRLTIPVVTRDTLLVLCLILTWMLPGLFGREPWKDDEAYTFGLIKHIIESGDWVVPTLAGEPFMEKPPIYFITAALFGKLFGGWLPLQDAARLANLFFLGLTAWSLGVAAKATGVKRLDTILALFGCLVLTVTAHYLVTDLALLAGVSMGLAGLMLSTKGSWQASLWLGLGAGVAFLSKGLLGPGILGLTALLLPLVRQDWRSREYVRTCVVALLVALPALVVWPVALWQRSPGLFHEWLWDNNFGRYIGEAGLGPQPDRGGYLNYLGHGAFPLWPIIVVSIGHWARGWRNASLAPATVLLLVGVSVLSLAAEARVIYVLPLLPALALIAVALPDEIKYWRWVQMCLSVSILGFVAYLWMGALQLDGLMPRNWGYSLFSNWVGLPAIEAPQFKMSRYVLSALAAIALCGWMLFPQSTGRSGFLRSWAAALALVYSTIMLLFMPWLAAGNDYRNLMTEVALNAQLDSDDCLLSIGLGESQRALLDYYAGIRTFRTVSAGPPSDCQVLLVQRSGSCNAPAEEIPQWSEYWRGSRAGDRGECLSLYEADPDESNSGRLASRARLLKGRLTRLD